MDDKFGNELIRHIKDIVKNKADLDDDEIQYNIRKKIAAHIYQEIQGGHYSVYSQDREGHLIDCSLEDFMTRLITYKFTRYELNSLLAIDCRQILYLGYSDDEFIVLTLV